MHRDSIRTGRRWTPHLHVEVGYVGLNGLVKSFLRAAQQASSRAPVNPRPAGQHWQQRAAGRKVDRS
jgi:hypothetical protein